MGVRLPPLAPLEASMKVAVEEMESCKRRLVVEAPADVVTKEWERAYDRVQKQARLPGFRKRSEEHTSELQSLAYLVCRLLLEKKKKKKQSLVKIFAQEQHDSVVIVTSDDV